jgi:hypothetical protein
VTIDEAASAAEAAAVEAEAAEAEVSVQVHARCIKQHVQTVNRKQKYLLCHPAIGQSTVKTATRNINHSDINQIINI